MEVTKKDVEKLIELKKENTFLNHLWTVFSRDFCATGEVGRNEIKVWRQSLWNMTFYPIFTFEFNSNNHLTNIRNNLNPVGKAFNIIASLWFAFLIFPKEPSDFDFIANWRIGTLILVFVLICVLVARMVYRFEKQNQLEQIFELLDIEVEKKNSHREWSLKNILIRMFTYPFSLFVIFICIWSLTENGNIIMTLFGIGICVTYLYADIKMILRKKKTTGNNV